MIIITKVIKKKKKQGLKSKKQIQHERVALVHIRYYM